MNCDCIERINEKLTGQNLELDATFLISKGFTTMLSISTHWKDSTKKIRGKKPTSIIVSYCPFCGVKADGKT